MFKIKLALLVVIGFVSLTNAVPVKKNTRINVMQMPSATALKKNLKKDFLYFMQVTNIVDKLADKEIELADVLGIIHQAIDTFRKTVPASFDNTQERASDIEKAILKDAILIDDEEEFFYMSNQMDTESHESDPTDFLRSKL